MKRFYKIFRIQYLLGIALMIGASSCHYHEPAVVGEPGRPGLSYLALSYDYAEPDYIEAGTSAIPGVFDWDVFYRINPGLYLSYYEGEFWNGRYWEEYAWEIEYEIWINGGEPGGYYYDGRDGADTYFTLVYSPYGPYVIEEADYYRSGKHKLKIDDKYEVIEESENKVIIQQKQESHTIKITYKKVPKRKA